MGNNNDKKSLKWLLYLILGGFLIKLFFYISKKDNWKKIGNNFKDFLTKEKKEVDELASGKESFKEYCKDSSSIFKNYFIPDESNDFKPKILRTKSLVIIAVALLFLKVAVTGYLFFIYPNLAKMTQLIQDEVSSLVNSERIENSVAILTPNEKLNIIAKRKAEDMIERNYFAHKSPDGKMIWDLIDRGEYPYLYVGENLAMNFTSAQSAHKALMLSPTHKKNILNSKYSDIGVAVVSGELNNKKTNVLVQVFAQAKAVKPALALDTKTEDETVPSPQVEEIKEPTVKPDEPKTTTETEIIKEPEEDKSQVLSEDLTESPNKELEALVLATAKEVSVERYSRLGATAKVINYSQYIFIGALVLLILLLFVNILVRISIQHKPVIIQTLLVILFVYSLLTIKFHFLENITEKILLM